MAHTAGGALRSGIDGEKVAAIWDWDYRTSPLYSQAERVALDVAVAAASVPNAVTDAMFAELRSHWSDEQVVEILGAIALFGFLNRWNDTLVTPLEEEAIEVGERLLAPRGWGVGKHRG
jgi:alkylhydroperoxidase family enzyme